MTLCGLTHTYVHRWAYAHTQTHTYTHWGGCLVENAPCVQRLFNHRMHQYFSVYKLFVCYLLHHQFYGFYMCLALQTQTIVLSWCNTIMSLLDTVLQQSFDKTTYLCLLPQTIDSWIIMHFALVLQLLTCVSHDPCLSTISDTQTHHTYAGQPVALLPYCLPSHQSWPQPPHCRGLFLFIKGGFPPLVLLLFASTSSFHSLTSSLLPVCAVNQWPSPG